MAFMRNVLLFVSMGCLLLLPSFAAEWRWSSTVLDPGEGTFTGLVSDKAGNLHLVYLNGSVTRYGFLPVNTEKWYQMELAPGGEYARVGLDPSGNPHVCTTGHGQLRHFWFDGKKWQVEQVSASTASIQFSCSVGVDARGTVHMVWYPMPVAGSDENVLHIRYGTKLEGVWYLRTLDSGQEAGKWNALAVDPNGAAHIVYSCFRDRKLGYATTKDNQWHFAAIDQKTTPLAEFPVGIGNDLIIAPDGRPRVGYEDSVTVRYGELDSNGNWKTETIDQIQSRHGWSDYRTRLAIDSSGNPHMVYGDAGALKHAWKDDAGWHVQYISPAGRNPRPYASIAAGPDNTLFVVYRDPKDGSLQLAKGTLGETGKQGASSQTATTKDENATNPALASRSEPKEETKTLATPPPAKPPAKRAKKK